MELGGVVTIKCEKTGYWAELEFKLKVSTSVRVILALKDDTDSHFDDAPHNSTELDVELCRSVQGLCFHR